MKSSSMNPVPFALMIGTLVVMIAVASPFVFFVLSPVFLFGAVWTFLDTSAASKRTKAEQRDMWLTDNGRRR